MTSLTKVGITMILTLLMTSTTKATNHSPGNINWDAVIYALHQMETSGRLGPIKGDGGAALGPLQIHRGYHADSGVEGPYDRVAVLDYAERVVRAYMARYATERRLGRPVKPVDIARIHNGGPNGYKKLATIKYGQRFSQHYNNYIKAGG